MLLELIPRAPWCDFDVFESFESLLSKSVLKMLTKLALLLKAPLKLSSKSLVQSSQLNFPISPSVEEFANILRLSFLLAACNATLLIPCCGGWFEEDEKEIIQLTFSTLRANASFKFLISFLNFRSHLSITISNFLLESLSRCSLRCFCFGAFRMFSII